MAKKSTDPNALVSSLKASAKSRLDALIEAEEEFPEPAATDTSESAQENPLDSSVDGDGNGLIDVHVEDLHEGIWNARKFYIDSRVEELANSLKKLGQEVPINVYRDEHKRLVIQDGHYRLRAAKRAGIQSLKAHIKPAPTDAISAFITSRAINVERNDQSVLDDSFRLKELIEGGAATQREIAKRLEMEEVDVSKLLALTKLPENIILTLMRAPSLLSKRFLYNLSIYFERRGENDTLRLAAEAVKNGMSARELELRKRIADRGPAEKPRSQRITLDKGQIKGYVKSFANGRIELRLEGLTDEDQKNVLDKLRDIFTE